MEGPTLAIVPATAIQTWRTEITNSASGFCLQVAYQNKILMSWFSFWVKANNQPVQPDNLRFATIIVTTKESLEQHVMSHCFNARERHLVVPFRRIVVDKAHVPHKLTTKFAGHMDQLTERCRCNAWFVMGTPLPKGPESVELAIHCW